MSIPVWCSCGRQFNAPPHLAGAQSPCPSCGKFAWVPAAARRPRVWPWLLGGFGVTVLLMVCAGVGGALIVRTAVNAVQGTALETQQEDYAVAREKFRTKLTRRGPSPQSFEPLSTPPGAQRVSYRSGGYQLTAFVDSPQPAAAPRPGVVFLHGGFAFGDGDWEMAQPFRNAGFVVMEPVLRGENGQPGHFTLYYDEVEDVLAAARHLKTLPHVDGDNIFVAGHSAGGALATLAALSAHDFRAAASYSGVMNQSMTITSDPELEVFDTSDPREIRMRSPEAYAGSFKCPARLFYGSREYFLKDGVERTAKAAQARGLKVDAVQVPGDHFSSVSFAITRTIPFFRQHMVRASSAGGGPFSGRRSEPASPPLSPPGFPSPGENPARPSPPPVAPPPTPPSSPIAAGTPVVIFQVLSYTGAEDPGLAARRALLRMTWIDPRTITYDADSGEIVVGVRNRSLNTAGAKAALESAGFEIGFTNYRSGGR